MNIPIYQIDAFTDIAFKGNPAAVVLLETPGEPAWMQAVAAEMNLSETSFVFPEGTGFNLRWFTPRTEVELCGHATLSAAHALWESGKVKEGKPITFFTQSGRLSIKKDRDLIEMDFPAAKVIQGDLPEEVVAAIGIVPDFIGISGEKWLLEYEDELTIRKISPDFAALRQYKGRGLIVTSLSERPGVDFVSRYFAPWVGIDEDPVTGSSHVLLAPYWGAKLGKIYLTAQQISARGGTLKLRLSGDRVYIAGKALTVFKGELLV